MRILLVNKFYFPQGGADKHVLELEQLLISHGHQVAVFAMAHPRNQPSPYAKYFVSQVDFEHIRLNWQGLRTFGRMFYSFEAKRKITALIRDFRPDVVHFHNVYHQLSPSVIAAVRQAGIPSVMTLHDYALVSANYNLYAHGGICLHGCDSSPWDYVKYRCIKNSWLASLAAALETIWIRLMGFYRGTINTFISPSNFLRDFVRQYGYAKENIRVIPNFTTANVVASNTLGEYFLYLGRLSSEKGVEQLLAASGDYPLKIVGTGPLEKELRQRAAGLKGQSIEFLGFRHGDELQKLIANARAVIVPSVWYENCPLVIIEAFAAGRPVIAAAIGGIPELVTPGKNGLLYTHHQSSELKAAMRQLWEHPEQARVMGQNAKNELARFQPGTYYHELNNIYAELVAKK